MFGFPEWHNDMMIKYTKLFGSLFDDLEVYRENSRGPASVQKVPLQQGSRDKTLAYAQQQFMSNDMAVATISPRIGYDLVGANRDNTRKTGKYLPISLSTGTMHNFIPYNLEFELYVIGKTEIDCQRIVEQILPFFDPSLTVNIFPFPNETYNRDIIITLNQVSKNDTYQGEGDQHRTVEWRLGFTMKAFLFGVPPQAGQTTIKKIITNFYNETANTQQESVTVYPQIPGSNTDYTAINPTDPYEIITDYTSNV